MSVQDGPLYLGLDLSTQQLKGVLISSSLLQVATSIVSFDADLKSSYPEIQSGVLTSGPEIYAPVAMWLDALDLLLARFQAQDPTLLGRVAAISGAGMQHGTVFWSRDAERALAGLEATDTLSSQLKSALSHEFSPNWQDASTQSQCEAFDAEHGSPAELASVTGSKAHHRFSGPQILKWHAQNPREWEDTARISLVSSFLASVLAGKIADIDISDVCGMNLWNVRDNDWDQSLLRLAAGQHGADDLRAKLGSVSAGDQKLGTISPYFVHKYGFSSSCQIVTCTGDNPSTMLALPLRAADAIVSLGTSTTFLMSTPVWRPDPAYHFMNHPTTAGLYMFMLCYKNGGLAREKVRNQLNESSDVNDQSWERFNLAARSTPPLSQAGPDDPMRLGLFFPRPEIVPNVTAGQWRYTHSESGLLEIDNAPQRSDARTIIESQMLSLRLRSKNLVAPISLPDGTVLPAQPRRIYLVGGGSDNPAIAEICGQVLGGAEGVYRLDIGGNACALGAAHKAVWASERGPDESFEDFVNARWHEDDFVRKIDTGYREGVFEQYGRALAGFEAMETDVIRRAGTN